MTNEVFLDTAYAIALSVESDSHHERAVRLAERLEAENIRLVTTRAVLLEIGNALSKKRYRQAAVELLNALERDPQVKIISLTEELYAQALELFRSRPDKEWGLIDCVSFMVMRERRLTEALTTENILNKQIFAHCCETHNDIGMACSKSERYFLPQMPINQHGIKDRISN